ncbi:MAG TPA: flavodoxin family protein [Myxococcota bacterium]|jgi:NAD(P)H dehydrogenase (quinone)
MSEIAVVFHSATGTTRKLAEAVQAGAAGVAGAAATLHEIRPLDIVDGRWKNDALLSALDAADAIVFGCPTFMGGPSAQMKAFLDGTLPRWYARVWVGKLGAAFTVSSTPSGDKLQTLTAIAVTAMQHGMLWVGVEDSPLNAAQANRLGIYVGAAGQADYTTQPPGVQAADLRTGERLGERVAKLAQRLRATA